MSSTRVLRSSTRALSQPSAVIKSASVSVSASKPKSKSKSKIHITTPSKNRVAIQIAPVVVAPVAEPKDKRLLRTATSTVVWFDAKVSGTLRLLELRRGATTWPKFPPSNPQRTWASEAEWRRDVSMIVRFYEKDSGYLRELEGLRPGAATWLMSPSQLTDTEWQQFTNQMCDDRGVEVKFGNHSRFFDNFKDAFDFMDSGDAAAPAP